MKKIICLALAALMTVLVFAGCAKKAEMQTIDPVKVTSVTTAKGPAEDKDAIVAAYNAATARNVVKGDKYRVGNPIVFVTTDGVVEVFDQGDGKFVAQSTMFDYAFEIESAELGEFFKAE